MEIIFTITEAAAASLTDRKYSPNEQIFIAPEQWGNVETVGTKAEWEAEIPQDEAEAARHNIWYSWYEEAALPYPGNFDSWRDFREDLLSELTPVTIAEEATN